MHNAGGCIDKTNKPQSPIKSGWRGDLNGFVQNTNDTQILVSEVTIKLDIHTAHALANHLTDRAIEKANSVEGDQVIALSNLGSALGRLIDHHSANNGGREYVK